MYVKNKPFESLNKHCQMENLTSQGSYTCNVCLQLLTESNEMLHDELGLSFRQTVLFTGVKRAQLRCVSTHHLKFNNTIIRIWWQLLGCLFILHRRPLNQLNLHKGVLTVYYVVTNIEYYGKIQCTQFKTTFQVLSLPNKPYCICVHIWTKCRCDVLYTALNLLASLCT